MKEKSEAKQVCCSLSVNMIYRNLYKNIHENSKKSSSQETCLSYQKVDLLLQIKGKLTKGRLLKLLIAISLVLLFSFFCNFFFSKKWLFW